MSKSKLTLSALKAKYKYGDMSDGEFAFKMWKKKKDATNDLSQATPMGEFADHFSLSNKQFKEMLAYSKLADYKPTGETFADKLTDEDRIAKARTRASFQGYTYGWGDEITGLLGSAVNKIVNPDSDFSETYEQIRNRERERTKQYTRTEPVKALAFELLGSASSPISKIGHAVKTVKGATAVGGATGGLFGLGASESEDVAGMATDTAVGATLGGSISGVAQKTLGGISAKQLKAGKEFLEENSPDKLRAIKNKAYKAVSDSDFSFDRLSVQDLYQKARVSAKKHNLGILNETDSVQTLKLLKDLSKKPLKLGELEIVRQKIGAYYLKNPDQMVLKDVIGSIDDMFKAAGKKNKLVEVARNANKDYKRSSIFDTEFAKTRRDLAINTQKDVPQAYLETINKILSTPALKMSFSKDQHKIMNEFIHGKSREQILRRISTMDPSSNKLSTVMAFAGSYLHPLFIAPTAAGAVAKKILKGDMESGVNKMILDFLRPGELGRRVDKLRGRPTYPAGVSGVTNVINEFNKEPGESPLPWK